MVESSQRCSPMANVLEVPSVIDRKLVALLSYSIPCLAIPPKVGGDTGSMI
jgi:hypothetical protein